jgi:hypothetical protein
MVRHDFGVSKRVDTPISWRTIVEMWSMCILWRMRHLSQRHDGQR